MKTFVRFKLWLTVMLISLFEPLHMLLTRHMQRTGLMAMTYSGATAASSLANPPALLTGYLGGGVNSTAFGVAASKGAKSVWLYNSSNQATEQMAAGFFSDAAALGMKQNDIILGCVSTGSSISLFVGVLSSMSTAGAAQLLSTGGFISSTR